MIVILVMILLKLIVLGMWFVIYLMSCFW